MIKQSLEIGLITQLILFAKEHMQYQYLLQKKQILILIKHP